MKNNLHKLYMVRNKSTDKIVGLFVSKKKAITFIYDKAVEIFLSKDANRFVNCSFDEFYNLYKNSELINVCNNEYAIDTVCTDIKFLCG